MAGTIQRMRYFDGEFLRSGDLTDEQGYHVEMRRRLTLGLHSAGIAYGLAISQDDDSVPPDLLFFSVSAGLAIDQDGREIVVTAPYLLSTDNVLGRAGLEAGDNELWIVYSEAATGLPQTGYAACDDGSQNTRIAESFEVLLKAKKSIPAKGKDPDVDLRGIRLGTIRLANDTVNGWTIIKADSVGRSYVGIRAQSIVTPDDADTYAFVVAAQNVVPATAPAKPLAPPGYLDVASGVFARDNLFVEQNAVLGDDFALAGSGSATVPDDPKANGNLKIAGDLFLGGDFYGNIKSKWLKLEDVIQSMMPEMHTDLAGVATISGASSGSVTVPLDTKIAPGGKMQATASLAGFTLIPGTPATDHLSVGVTATAGWVAGGAQVVVSWMVGPVTTSGTTQIVPFESLQFAYTVVVTPGPM